MMVGYAFHVGLFHSLLFAGFYRRFLSVPSSHSVTLSMPVFRLIWRMLNPSRANSLTLLYMVSFFNCVLIALGFDLVGTFKLRAMGVFYANPG